MWRMANFHVVHPSLSKIYVVEDFDQLINSERCFVRKVTTAQSTGLMNRIDAALDEFEAASCSTSESDCCVIGT